MLVHQEYHLVLVHVKVGYKCKSLELMILAVAVHQSFFLVVCLVEPGFHDSSA